MIASHAAPPQRWLTTGRMVLVAFAILAVVAVASLLDATLRSATSHGPAGSDYADISVSPTMTSIVGSADNKAPAAKPADEPAKPTTEPKAEAKVHVVTLQDATRYIRTKPTTAGNKPLREIRQGAKVRTLELVKGQDPYGDSRNMWLKLEGMPSSYMWASGTDAAAVYDARLPAKKLKLVAQSTPMSSERSVRPASRSATRPVAKPQAKVVAKPKVKKTFEAKFVRPLKGGRFTSGYKWRWGRMHAGIDLAAPTGTSIRAVASGTVLSSGWRGACGKAVRIRHAKGIVTMYCHASRLYVRAGQKVEAGQRIAAVGSTGRSTGPHLHFSVFIRGEHVNPRPWLRNRGIRV